MSVEALGRIIERASTDAAFRAQLSSTPEVALAGYELTADERAALLRQHTGELGALGVEPRVTKLGGPGPEEHQPYIDWIIGAQG
jgi:hypothetical protein